ncbi:MAG: hypothetical protein A2Y33_08965 [Spirochaetes bacterium GWF1_51_8]|nr:MAG: hypothetical protein A2Y33_08965 [Spirochaetes bacterium GWF1_51_8]
MTNRGVVSGILTVILCIGAGVAGYIGLFAGKPTAAIEGRITSSKQDVAAGESADFIFFPSAATNRLILNWEIVPSGGVVLTSPTNSEGNLKANVFFKESGSYKISAGVPVGGKKWIVSEYVIDVK